VICENRMGHARRTQVGRVTRSRSDVSGFAASGSAGFQRMASMNSRESLSALTAAQYGRTAAINDSASDEAARHGK